MPKQEFINPETTPIDEQTKAVALANQKLCAVRREEEDPDFKPGAAHIFYFTRVYAVSDLIAAGLSYEAAILAIDAISSNRIAHVTINNF